MFGIRRDPLKRLEKSYAKKTAEANAAQRAGKIPEFAKLTKEAEDIGRQLDIARANSQSRQK